MRRSPADKPAFSSATRARAWLSRPRAGTYVIALAIAIASITVPSGLVLDDHIHALALRGVGEALPSARRAPWDAFAFAKDPASVARMIDDGIFPWWSDVHARFAFLRPVTSLSLWLDHRLWPHSPAWMHIQNLLWYALLLYVVRKLYGRFGASAEFVTLALAAYALDDTRAMAVGWIADRGALLGLSAGFGCVLAHDRWRSSQRARWLVAALGLLGLGLLCAEAAVQATAYLFAYACFIDTSKTRERIRSLVPYGVLVVLWRAIYSALGYGAAHTELYVDPGSSPLRFAKALLWRLPLLLGSQFWGISAELHDMLKYVDPALQRVVIPLDLLSLAVLLWMLAPLWKRSRKVRFWATGAVLSTIPVCAAMPSDRLLTATGLGGSALVALVVLGLADRVQGLRTRPRVITGTLFGAANLLLGPLLLPVTCLSMFFLGNYIEQADRSLPDRPELAGQTLVLLNLPSDDYGIYLPFNRAVKGRVMPKHFRWLSTADTDLHITRLDPYRLKIRPERGFLPPGSFWVLRAPETRAYVGQTIALTGATIRVTDITADDRPAEIVIRFDEPLDAEHFVWMRWSERGGFERFVPPPPGASSVVAKVPYASVLKTL